MDKNSPKIVVLGAGVVGMTLASIIQDNMRHADITVIADKFQEDTTSAVAAGIFAAGSSFRGPTKDLTKKWIVDSWRYWQDILNSPEAPQAGAMAFSCYVFSKESYQATRNHLIEDLVPIYRSVRDDELKLCGDGWKYGSYYSTLKIGCDRYLPWIERKFTEQGGKIEKIKITSFASVSNKFDLVFNCTGLGAKSLCNDEIMVPIKGQIIRVKAPWLKCAFFGDDDYVIPGFDGVATLGGVRHYDTYNLEVCKYDAAAIFDRCSQLLPALKNAVIVAHKTGLRPHRVPVRVEPELFDGLRVVHCYGHGGNGVASAPGTALHAVNIGLDLLKSNVRNKL